MSIDAQTVLTTLREVVEQFGPATTYAQRYEEITDGSYDTGMTCKYQIDGNPVCIVGVALDRLGIPYDPSWEDESITSVAGEYLDGTFTDGAIGVLAVAQDRQDGGDSWGDALLAAERRANR